jgi:protein-S-isoprenylcysteine O-methyltransferase Ste14
MKHETWQLINYGWMAFAAIIFLVLLKVTAPYGRHTSTKWGPQISNRLGWVFMEAPGMMVLLHYVISSATAQTAVTWTLVSFFLFHYVNRSFIFPFRIHTKKKKMPVVIMLMGILFNLVNGFLLGTSFAWFSNYQPDYFFNWRFILGTLLFAWGIWINWDHDTRLINLRAPGETGYKIPHGGLFRYISCPNLFGEILEWTGYAILCWNLAALSFLVWTAANLIPRALSHHKWYRSHFPDYPAERKAVIPFVV